MLLFLQVEQIVLPVGLDGGAMSFHVKTFSCCFFVPKAEKNIIIDMQKILYA